MNLLKNKKMLLEKKLRDYIGNGLFGQGPVVLFFLTLHFFVAQTDINHPKRKQRGQYCPHHQINQHPSQRWLRKGKHQGNKDIADKNNVPHGISPIRAT